MKNIINLIVEQNLDKKRVDAFIFIKCPEISRTRIKNLIIDKRLKINGKVNFLPSKKINFYLKGFKKFFSGRKVLIAREITKIHETFIRDEIDNIKPFKNTMKGELTLVVSEDNSKSKIIDEEKIVNKIKKYLKKYSLKDTVDLVVETEKVNKKKIYRVNNHDYEKYLLNKKKRNKNI